MKKYYRRLLCLCLPFPLLFIVIYCLPFIGTIPYAFFEAAFKKSFAGFAHFEALFANRNFLLAAKNSMLQVVCYVPALMCIALFLAFVFEKTALNKHFAVRVFIVLPMLIPSVTLVSLIKPLTDGALRLAPRGGAPFFFLLLLYLYQNVGFSFVIFSSALRQMSADITQAALIDGASPARAFFSVQLPLLTPQVSFCFLLGGAQVFQNFQASYLLYGNYPDASVYTIQHFLNNHFFKLNYPLLAAATLVFFTLFSLLSLMLYRLSERRKD